MTEIDKTKPVQDTASLDDFNRGVVEEFRANGGKVGGPFEGGNLLLLHTTGAKSGRPRLSPLAYLTIDGKMLIIGSYAGAPKDPAWVHNLRAKPQAHIEVGPESYRISVAHRLTRTAATAADTTSRLRHRLRCGLSSAVR
jgi:deazaflavin-dependent oxidoreductase (nitroreductase family)